MAVMRAQYTFDLVFVYACQWKEMQRQDSAISDFVDTFRLPNHPQMDQLEYHNDQDLIADIMKDKIKGVVQCSLRIPEHQRERCRNLGPIFYKQTFKKKDLYGINKMLNDRYNYLTADRELLVSGFEVSDKAFLTAYIKYLVDHYQCEVYDIKVIYQFNMTVPFKGLVEQCIKIRKEAGNNEVLANTQKDLLNSWSVF